VLNFLTKYLNKYPFDHRYIGAVRFSEVCENLQHAAKKNPVDENEVLEIYLEMMLEGKELKKALAKRNEVADPNFEELERYCNKTNSIIYLIPNHK
jgi:hypothetical protein